jgi:hypothetical protein
MARREEDVCGFDVAVEDIMAVRVAECIGYLTRDLDRVFKRQLSLAIEALTE